MGTELKSIPCTISWPGFYYLTKDLNCSAGSDGIIINANDVTLDLMGYSLIGAGSDSGDYHGVRMTGRNNVEIRNGTVREFGGKGINESGSSAHGHRLISLRVKENGSFGIYLNGSGHLIEGCTALGNGVHGMFANSGSTITENTCYNNGSDGIYASTGSTVTQNTCYGNSRYGFYFFGSNLVDQNAAFDNGMGSYAGCSSGCAMGTNLF